MSKTFFRADVAQGLVELDREAEVVRGYAVISKGMARGHGLEIDDTTLDQVVTLGNSSRGGVKSRFGHPNMSSESLGTFLGRAKEFRRDGDVVRADLHIDETAHETPKGDLGKYVLDLAESDPDAFGSSIVFEGEAEHRVEEDGTPSKDEAGKDLPALARVKKLHASDIVDSPAANEGLFSVQWMTPDCELSAKASEFLDKFLSKPEAVDRAVAFLARYMSNRADHEVPHMAEPKTPDPVVSDPKPVEQPALAEKPEIDVAAVELKAKQSERARIIAIQDAAGPGQDALAREAIDKGMSLEDAFRVLLSDRKAKDATRLSEIRKDTVPALGPNEETSSASPDSDDPEKKWEADANLRREFRDDKDSYLAFFKADKAGRIRRRVSIED